MIDNLPKENANEIESQINGLVNELLKTYVEILIPAYGSWKESLLNQYNSRLYVGDGGRKEKDLGTSNRRKAI